MRRPEPKRREPRPMSSVMQHVVGDLAPTDPLARMQTAWPQLVGKKHAEHSEPARIQGDGTIVIRCDSGAMASELSLREPQIRALMVDLLDLHGGLRFQGPAGSAVPKPRRGS